MNSDHRLDRIHALNLEFAAVEEKLISEILLVNYSKANNVKFYL